MDLIMIKYFQNLIKICQRPTLHQSISIPIYILIFITIIYYLQTKNNISITNIQYFGRSQHYIQIQLKKVVVYQYKKINIIQILRITKKQENRQQNTMMNKQTINRFIFQTTNILKVQDFLQENPDIDPRQFHDNKENNILHQLCFNDQKQLIKLYIVHTSRLIQRRIQSSKNIYKRQTKNQIAVWVNQQNQEGFTPILYASFNGHVQLINYLVQIGANYSIVNLTKLNVLHMAAQNNKVSSLIYFQGKVDYNAVDSKGSTPLHWASYNSSEQVVAYLLTLENIKINLKDIQGNTPLLLATIYGNTKIVRRLLFKGANRDIKNIKGQLAIQIAKQNQYKNIAKMLNDDYNCCDLFKFYYNVKLQYKPKQRNYTIPIVFMLTTFCSILIMNCLLKFTQAYLYVIQCLIFGIMLALYASLLVPAKQSQQKQNIQLYINQTKKICFECVRKKPKRSYHCQICKTCIQQYDHHCTWINNCVGKRNIGRFIIFIFILLVSLGLIGFTACWGLLQIVFNIHIFQDLIQFRQDAIIDDNFHKWTSICLSCLNIIISLFILPVLLLFIVQIKNLLINKTTYQRIKNSNLSVRDQLKKKKKRGPSLANCKAMCSETRQSFSSDQSMEERMLTS